MAAGPCVFVTGIWKSGNHLAYSALNELGVAGPANGISGHVLYGKYWLAKRLLRRPWRRGDGVQVGLETDALVGGRYIARETRKMRGQIMGGHAAHSAQIEAVMRDEGVRMICIRRDPRDILVSFADWIEGRPDYFLHQVFEGLSREQKVARLLKGGRGRGFVLHPFVEVLRRAEGWLTAPDVLQISFEGLVGAHGGGDAGTQEDVIAALHAHVEAPKPMEEVRAENIYGGTRTFNKGRSQRWRELQDSALVEEINAQVGPELEKWGYAA